MDILQSSINASGNSSIYRPVYYRIHDLEDERKLHALIKNNPDILIYDTIYTQLTELIRLQHPTQRPDAAATAILISEHAGKDLKSYGVWVYYPWSKKLVHLLDEEEFVFVRTSRNIYKITPEEIQILRNKKIGIIGLSVGQSIALTLATERTCGELRLADFDEIELSNMNRIKVGVAELGLNKAIVAARQIAELDPFIDVKCFTSGVNAQNINSFFTEDGKLDILVEECDGIDIKILSRIKAKSLGIPVIMDTNDKGMLDVERFDLEPERPIFHGKVPELEAYSEEELTDKLRTLTIPEKIEYLARIIGFENLSPAMLRSVSEMNKTIVGWPQLASAVTLGGAMITDVSRKILLQQFSVSGRFFVDFDELVQEDKNTIK
ncbi:ThiF family adenylyltransferase [Pedobacter antarcticus]|uniref:ThiF family adenylyltransferase n=1 Tax=Pedobacter antarcticus TaxID=34086 RepID=UPI00088C9706|nr:ThiF family adenylyltransferase [Pedobacter antarcticus]SDL72185.1 ThiF family protein [Pedobacter antarcticus]